MASTFRLQFFYSSYRNSCPLSSVIPVISTVSCSQLNALRAKQYRVFFFNKFSKKVGIFLMFTFLNVYLPIHNSHTDNSRTINTHTIHNSHTYNSQFTIHTQTIHNSQFTPRQFTIHTHTIHNSQFTHRQFTIHPQTIHNSQFTHRQFTIHPQTIHNSQFTHRQFTDNYRTLFKS